MSIGEFDTVIKAVPLVEYVSLPVGTLEVLAKLTVELAKMELAQNAELALENFAPVMWKRLLEATFPPPYFMRATPNG